MTHLRSSEAPVPAQPIAHVDHVAVNRHLRQGTPKKDAYPKKHEKWENDPGKDHFVLASDAIECLSNHPDDSND
jgi:hypothetical protein